MLHNMLNSPARSQLPAWFILFLVLMGLFIILPFLAPFFMFIGWEWGGKAIYLVYTLFCHQLPQRSYFLFGPEWTYSLVEIQAVWQPTTNPMILRQFIGNSEMGWKVAWSDRMISMYGSIWLFGLLWYPLRKQIRNLPLWGLILFILPMAIDGTTHLISDFWGIGLGFRDTNLWLANLTRHSLPAAFYTGDAWGSFNSIMRLSSGLLFGWGFVWFAFPFIHPSLPESQIPSSY
ncbi:MAG: DUF2085 domain-containing protein [Candidatus Latescibacteria bacterium]|nr:DUF2085 domain-containing protein [Candidatus Latescibacterota bacterium]